MTTEEKDQLLLEHLQQWLSENPVKLNSFLVLEMGRKVVHSDYNTLIISLDADIEKDGTKKRYTITCEASVTEIPLLNQPTIDHV